MHFLYKQLAQSYRSFTGAGYQYRSTDLCQAYLAILDAAIRFVKCIKVQYFVIISANGVGRSTAYIDRSIKGKGVGEKGIELNRKALRDC